MDSVDGFVEEGLRLSLVPCEAENLGPKAVIIVEPAEDVILMLCTL